MHGSQVWRTSLQTACGLPKYCDIVTAETQTKSTHRITSAQNGKKLEVDGLFPANPSSEFSPRSHLNPRSPLRGEAGGFDDRDCSASVELALEWSCVCVCVFWCFFRFWQHWLFLNCLECCTKVQGAQRIDPHELLTCSLVYPILRISWYLQMASLLSILIVLWRLKPCHLSELKIIYIYNYFAYCFSVCLKSLAVEQATFLQRVVLQAMIINWTTSSFGRVQYIQYIFANPIACQITNWYAATLWEALTWNVYPDFEHLRWTHWLLSETN